MNVMKRADLQVSKNGVLQEPQEIKFDSVALESPSKEAEGL